MNKLMDCGRWDTARATQVGEQFGIVALRWHWEGKALLRRLVLLCASLDTIALTGYTAANVIPLILAEGGNCVRKIIVKIVDQALYGVASAAICKIGKARIPGFDGYAVVAAQPQASPPAPLPADAWITKSRID